MDFDIEQTDMLLSTTRAVRRRLDLERNVPDRLLYECIQLAEQAPTGAGIASRRWMVIRDPETKRHTARLEVELSEWEFGIFKEKIGEKTPITI